MYRKNETVVIKHKKPLSKVWQCLFFKLRYSGEKTMKLVCTGCINISTLKMNILLFSLESVPALQQWLVGTAQKFFFCLAWK